MIASLAVPSPFGALLKEWRRVRGVSQLDLATRAASTPRHISFLESGRSQPRRSMVLRLSAALALPHRESNELLVAAGLAAEYPESNVSGDDLGVYREAIDALLASHEPLPACVVDRWGTVILTNEAFDQLNPGVLGMTPEMLVEATFGSDEGRARVVNWEEIAWAYVDRMSAVSLRTADPRIAALVEQVRGYLGDRERPSPDPTPHVSVKFLVDGVVLSTFTTFVRFDNARDVSLSELAVELVFPADDQTREYFLGRGGAVVSPGPSKA